MNNEKNNKELKLNYTISIIISLIGLVAYIIFDFFSTVRTTLWSEIAYKAIAELYLSWSLSIIIFFFLAYIFLEGLQFTDNTFLQKLSKNSNTFYNLGVELTFIIIPLIIFLILQSMILLFDLHIYLLVILYIIAVVYIGWAVKKLYGGYGKKFNLMVIRLILIGISVLGFFGFMQLITAEVNINFDQNYYRTNDYVIITIDRSGITPPEIINVDPKTVFLKLSNKNETELITSNQGRKKIIIYKIDNSLDFGNFNYQKGEVVVNYSVNVLEWKIPGTKTANFIILK